MAATTPYGVLTPSRQSLSVAQRQYFNLLRSRGIDEATARELALTTVQKRARRSSLTEELAALKSAWDESSHPRAKDGTFGQGDGASMGHQDHYAVADKANRAASAALARGDSEAAASNRAIADKHTQMGLAKQALAIDSFHPSRPGDHIRLETMKGEMARRTQATKKSRQSEHLALYALDVVAKKRTQFFEAKFVEHAKDQLPGHWYDQVHASARAATGGQQSGRVRRENKSVEAKRQALAERGKALEAQMQQWEQDCATLDAEEAGQLAETALKSVMAPGEIHVDVPLTSQPKRRKKLQQRQVKKFVAFDEDVQLAADALALGDEQRLVGAQRLAAGMDWEIRMARAASPQEARARASRQLAQDAAYYDNKMQRNAQLRLVKGLDVDLGSGQVREPGYLGLDLYPYDYGTAIYDVAAMDLPFPDTSVRSFRLVHALQYMPDLADDATPLLVEIQRCINYGGQLLYVGLGDLTQKVDMRQIPGLVLVEHEDNQPLEQGDTPDNNQLTRQTFERVRVKVPRTYGADPEWLGLAEEGPDDIALALAAYGAGQDADQAMSRLFKSAQLPTNADVTLGGGAPLPGAQAYKKIIHAVVYAPNELDYDGEFMEADQIEEAAHRAFKDQIPIRSEHDNLIGAHLVESYIAPVDLTLQGANGPQFVPKGSWVVAIQFTDDQEWAKVLNGQYRGISVGGRALLEQR